MTATEFAYPNFFNHSETLLASCSHRCNRSPVFSRPPAPASAPRSPELSVRRRSHPASPRAQSSRGALRRGRRRETALPPGGQGRAHPPAPLSFTRTEGRSGEQPSGAGEASLGRELQKKTFQMQQIAEEKGREVRTRGVCGVRVCACVTLHQTCKPVTCLQPAVLSVVKTRCIHFEQGSQKENSDEEINTKNLLSKALEGK